MFLVFIEIYGCQMNVNDAEIVWSILQDEGYTKTNSIYDADIALLVTCAIRDSAEQKVWTRIKQIRSVKRWRGKLEPLKIGILGNDCNYFLFIYNYSCSLNFNYCSLDFRLYGRTAKGKISK